MFCINCGAKINDGDSFCTNCGQKIVQSNETNSTLSLSEQVKKSKTVNAYSKDTTIEEMDTIKFGLFPQNNLIETEKEPIEWVLLEKNNNEAFLLSKFILDFKEFGKFDDYRVDYPCWENSPIRNWLNTDFFNNAFNIEEQEIIKLTEIINLPDSRYNYVGKNSNDRLFLLSDEEIIMYFEQIYNEDFDENLKNENKKCATKATKYAKRYDNGMYGGLVAEERKQDMWWSNNDGYWLRSKGKEQSDASSVDVAGIIMKNTYSNSAIYGVRPAMWVKI